MISLYSFTDIKFDRCSIKSFFILIIDLLHLAST